MKFFDEELSWRQQRMLNRIERMRRAKVVLAKKGITFREVKPDVLLDVHNSAHYWPLTGNWHLRETNEHGKGLASLLTRLGDLK